MVLWIIGLPGVTEVRLTSLATVEATLDIELARWSEQSEAAQCETRAHSSQRYWFHKIALWGFLHLWG
ncbi:MAG: hypothetical protein LBR70_02105 [Lactobacillaceae bacterium]|jgi:hypothetical protein|nr:hypothetical protein [Lactobacillaceae bacterium]